MPGAFPDTGPQADGHRSEGQWLNAMAEDMGIIRRNIEDVAFPRERAMDQSRDKSLSFAVALKESRRLTSDIYRYAQEVHGITREEIDRHHT